MKPDQLFERLWNVYASNNPSVLKIHELFTNEGETIINDHIAFRTLNDPRIHIEEVAKPFEMQGYVPMGEYFFEDKHLFARHYELPGQEDAPRIFISELKLEEMSSYIQNTYHDLLEQALSKTETTNNLIFSGDIFAPHSYEIYSKFRQESEYAAWFYVFGFRANHFTVSVNALKKINTLEKVNQLLKDHGFALNTSGGEIKGSTNDMLRQSSTLADVVNIKFVEGNYDIPCCYYEFAQRYESQDGKIFGGFVAKSADKIFESTDNFTIKK